MGVTGLWKLIEQSGKPVPLETLENKILAVDISIWLHQVVKGFQDNRGATLPNAHLLGLFHRLCKLLFYKIKPVFVFDGGVPELKRETIVKRSKNKVKYQSEADRLHQMLLDSLAKEKIVQQALGPSEAALLASPAKAAIQPPPDDRDDIFKLPPMKENELDSSLDQSQSASDLDDSESSIDEKVQRNYGISLQDIDVKSSYFQGLPPDIRHEILTDIKETRKQSSWGRLHELPAESINFSSFQMKRLLKRRQVQVELEEAEKEIGGKSLSLLELEALLSEKGVVDPEIAKQRVVCNEHVRYLHVRDLKKAMDRDAKTQAKVKRQESHDTSVKNEVEDIESNSILCETLPSVAEEEYDLQRAIQLSLQSDPNDVSRVDAKTSDDVRLTTDQRGNLRPTATCLARDYMLEYCGMNDDDINRLVQPAEQELDISQTQFRYNDDSILNGIKKSTGTITSANNVNEPQPSTSKQADIIELMSDSSDELFSSDADSDFIDVPDPGDITFGFNLKPIHMNSPPATDLSKDFRLDDLNRKNIEVVVKTDQLHNDDIFADIFANKSNGDAVGNDVDSKIASSERTGYDGELVMDGKSSVSDILKNLDQEMTEITKLNLNNIQCVPEEVPPTEPEFSQDKTPTKQMSPATCMEIKSTEKSLQSTPPKSIAIVDLETTPPKVPQPFFVNRTPSSKKKPTAESSVEPKLVVKKLFETNPAQLIIDEREAIATAADLLKETKSKDELEFMASKLRTERNEMEMERNKRDRLGVSITDRMVKECMDLLRLFGVPYIVAPMEAEAQCAFLNQIELTDGTITDDSDIWLFGGQTVYKNFFDQNKYVLEFNANNIEKLFHIDRNKLIQMSILVGSDYTPGIHGIGTVTALEVLGTFATTPEKQGETDVVMSLLSSLRKFRDWWQHKTVSPRTQALRNKLKNITFTENFPSSRVVQAYLYPQVDQSKERFEWGHPDEISIRDFAKSSFGWTRQKTDDILLPVLKKLNDKVSQQSIRNYFKSNAVTSRKELLLSKRVRSALNKFSNSTEDITPALADQSEATKPAGRKRAKKPTAADADATKHNDEKASVKPKMPKASKTRKMSTRTTVASADVDEPELESPYFAKPSTSKEARVPDYNPPIPQRERDKAKMEQNKLLAIQLLKKENRKKK